MNAKGYVDEAMDSYRGDALEAVLIGTEHWPDFLSETGLKPSLVGTNDEEVFYRGVSCRPSVTPDQITLLTGD